MAEITALIRYKNSAETLPDVLSALQKQSLRPTRILGVDSGSTDGSTELLKEAGADIVKWSAPYHHSAVLNYGAQRCETPYVLCLSSHTTMHDPDTLERMARFLGDDRVCACSIKWDDDPYYTDLIDWNEIEQKGIKFGSIYSNSLGMFKRELWEPYHFDEKINGMEDYDWALYQLKAGYKVSRIDAKISYLRSAHNRDRRDTARTFHLAHRYGLKVKWLGTRAALGGMLKTSISKVTGDAQAAESFDNYNRRLTGAIFWRFYNLNIN